MNRLRWTVAAAALVLQLLVGPRIHPALVVTSILLVATVGMGHGALDLWLSGRLSHRLPTPLFLVLYAGGMGLMLLLWRLSPNLAFAGFVLLSAYHFGEVRGHGPLLAMTHGLFVIGVAASAAPPETIALLEAMSVSVPPLPPTWTWLLLHLGFVGFIAAHPGRYQGLLTEARDSVIIFFLLTTLHPVIGFAIYFGLWHAVDHVAEVVGRWRRPKEQRSDIFKAAVGPTVAALAMFLLWAWATPHASGIDLVGGMIVLLSLLTVPHAAMVTWTRHLPLK